MMVEGTDAHRSAGGAGGFGLLEALFFSSNLTKLGEGGWLPMALGAGIFLMLTTWKEGSRLLASQRGQIDVPMDGFVKGRCPMCPHVFGTAVYLTSGTDPGAQRAVPQPQALQGDARAHRLPARGERGRRASTTTTAVDVTQLGPGIYNVDARFGFREEPDVPAALALAAWYGLELEPMTTTYSWPARASSTDPARCRTGAATCSAWMMRRSEGRGDLLLLPGQPGGGQLGTQVMPVNGPADRAAPAAAGDAAASAVL